MGSSSSICVCTCLMVLLSLSLCLSVSLSLFLYIYIRIDLLELFLCVYISLSLPSSYRTTRADFPDSLSPLVSVVHRFRKVLHAISCIRTEQLHIGSSWSSNPCWSVWRGPQEYIAYNFACLVRLIWMVFEMGDRWPYRCSFVGCCLQDFFIRARNILVLLLLSFFSLRLVSISVLTRPLLGKSCV